MEPTELEKLDTRYEQLLARLPAARESARVANENMEGIEQQIRINRSLAAEKERVTNAL